MAGKNGAKMPQRFFIVELAFLEPFHLVQGHYDMVRKMLFSATKPYVHCILRGKVWEHHAIIHIHGN